MILVYSDSDIPEHLLGLTISANMNIIILMIEVAMLLVGLMNVYVVVRRRLLPSCRVGELEEEPDEDIELGLHDIRYVPLS